MHKNIILFPLFVFLVGCGPSTATVSDTPYTTQSPDIDTQTPKPTAVIVEEPVTIDFGGEAVYTQLHYDDVETGELLPGFAFSKYGEAVITDEPDQVIEGDYSIRLSQYGHLKTNPEILPLNGNTIYLVEFDYTILERGDEEENIMYFIIQPSGEKSEFQDLWISTSDMLRNADTHGSFTVGGMMGNAQEYVLSINTTKNASVVIDNLHVLSQDVRVVDQQPDHWGELQSMTFPRLGNYALGSPTGMAYGMDEGVPEYYYSVNQIEDRLAMFDVIAGFEVVHQTMDSGLTYRLRSKNPDIVILPYSIAHEHGIRQKVGDEATVDIYNQFQIGLADEWIVKQTNGEFVPDPGFPWILKMNISEYCPVINGQTFQDYQIEWVVNTVLNSGNWDGIFFDNLFGHINPHINNRWDPALLDYDFNRNGLRDETPASSSEMTREASISLLSNIRDKVGNKEIILGNSWAFPEIQLAHFVNGYVFECVNEGWDSEFLPDISEPAWRLIFEEYSIMQTNSMSPTINILQGCGNQSATMPTIRDYQNHRFVMGTALLRDGFYEYDLLGNLSAPFWFDEYTVNHDGVAEEALENKGYLGNPLGDAAEHKSPAVTIWEEDFEIGTMPAELRSASGVYVSQEPGEVIDGSGSLVIDNPDHSRWNSIATSSNVNLVTFLPGETYVVEFDWRIIESLDLELRSYIWNGTDEVPHYLLPGVVTGDAGKAYFPMTTGTTGGFRLTFQLLGGGGKVAIDNVRVNQGGAGPWRRDFENGFVLVNPLNRPCTFTLDELRGDIERTGIKRILGTQAPEVNNGQPVVDSLTLQPFDAIILLADPIPPE